MFKSLPIGFESITLLLKLKYLFCFKSFNRILASQIGKYIFKASQLRQQ